MDTLSEQKLTIPTLKMKKKRRKKLADKTPYSNAGNSNNNNNNIDGTLKILEDITVLEPGKNGQIAAKKIREKY